MTNRRKPNRPQPKNESLDPEVKACVVKITDAWQKSVLSIIETGRQLLDAKKQLRHGQFGEMIKKNLPFTPRTAQILMNIARHPVLQDANYSSHLPPCWRTLDTLTQVPKERLIAALTKGKINPESTLADAKHFAGHLYASVRDAVRTLLQFRRDWENASDLGPVLYQRVECRLLENEVLEMEKLPEWIGELQASLKQEQERSIERTEAME